VIKYLKLAATREGHLLTRQKTETLKRGKQYTYSDSAAFLVAFLEFPPFHSNLEHVPPARRRLGRQRGSSNAQLDPQSPERTLFPGSFNAFLVVPSIKETRARPDWPHSVTRIQVRLMIDCKWRNRPTKSQKVWRNMLREMVFTGRRLEF
jgi:hypothetical protein